METVEMRLAQIGAWLSVPATTQLKWKLASIQSGLHKNFKGIIKIERRV
jgi:hypothetical protein